MIDSNKCISYQTLETRAEIKTPLNPHGWVAGCDICQEVCPFNYKASKNSKDISKDHDWNTLLLETEEDYKKRTHRTALDRIKYQDFKRNLLIALSHSDIKIDKNTLKKTKNLITRERTDILTILDSLISS